MKRLLIAAAVAATFAAPSAFADSTASATLGPISVTLFDLNPFDNVAASITFAPGNQSYAYSYSYQPFPYDSQSASNYSVGTWDPVSAMTSTLHASNTSSLSGSSLGNAVGALLSSTSGTTNPVASNNNYYNYEYANAGGSVYGANSFTLSANTAVIFSATASISGSAQGAPVYSFYYGDYAQANVNFNVSGPSASGSGSQNSGDSLVQGAYAYQVGPAVYTFSDSRTMGASFVNFTSGNLSGNLDASVSTYTYSFATPVPEPETYAMMLAGLGLMGAIARRKQKKS